jgi:hypothetical protein
MSQQMTLTPDQRAALDALMKEAARIDEAQETDIIDLLGKLVRAFDNTPWARAVVHAIDARLQAAPKPGSPGKFPPQR